MMRKRTRQALATGTVMIAILTCFLILFGLMLSSSSQMNLITRNMRRVRAVLMAESGVDASLITLTSNWNAATVAGSLYEDPGTNTKQAGTYSCAITEIDSNHRKVVSVGTDYLNGSATVVAIVNKEDLLLSKYAMLANGDISINGNVSVATEPVSQHTASVHANQNISMGNNSVVDGTLSAVGSITGGTGYFPNQASAPNIPFPDAAQRQAWIDTWKAEASAGSTYTAHHLFSGHKTSVTIHAPAWINGDVTIGAGEELRIEGPGTVWITGDIHLTSDGVLTNTALLAVGGKMTQSGQSVYQAGSYSGSTPYTATLILCSGDSDIAGGGVAQGIIYNMSGNLTVTGNSAFIGSLISGGDITAVGTYDQAYPTDQSTRVAFPLPPHVEKIMEP